MSPVRSESAIAGSVGIAADESVVRHSHYYDAAFYRALAETGSVDGRRILERAAATAAFRAMIGSVGVAPDFEVASLFASTGLGAVQKCDFDVEGGSVCLAPSGFVKARLEMFGKSSQPICDISRGVLSGALGAFFGAHFQVKEVECVAMGAKVCRFVARPDRTATTTTLPPFVWGGRGLAPPLDTAVDATAHDLVAQVASGAEIGAGLTPGRLWAEIYGRATHDFEAEIVGGMGAKFTNLASIVLTEAAHLATFYSVGELLRSKGWRQRVAPTIQAREDWAQTIVGLADSYGWGAWRVRLLAPEQRFTVHVHDGYEALSYRALAEEPATSPRCYFARGFVGGLMNVLFGGDVLAPQTLDQKAYNSLFRSPASFRAIETRCQAMGHPCCEFVANPLSPGLRGG